MVALEMPCRLTRQLTHLNVPCSSISVILIWGFRYIYTVKTGHATSLERGTHFKGYGNLDFC